MHVCITMNIHINCCFLFVFISSYFRFVSPLLWIWPCTYLSTLDSVVELLQLNHIHSYSTEPTVHPHPQNQINHAIQDNSNALMADAFSNDGDVTEKMIAVTIPMRIHNCAVSALNTPNYTLQLASVSQGYFIFQFVFCRSFDFFFCVAF